jgi:hypothetical protein
VTPGRLRATRDDARTERGARGCEQAHAMEAISPPFARETARGNSLVPTR